MAQNVPFPPSNGAALNLDLDPAANPAAQMELVQADSFSLRPIKQRRAGAAGFAGLEDQPAIRDCPAGDLILPLAAELSLRGTLAITYANLPTWLPQLSQPGLAVRANSSARGTSPQSRTIESGISSGLRLCSRIGEKITCASPWERRS